MARVASLTTKMSMLYVKKAMPTSVLLIRSFSRLHIVLPKNKYYISFSHNPVPARWNSMHNEEMRKAFGVKSCWVAVNCLMQRLVKEPPGSKIPDLTFRAFTEISIQLKGVTQIFFWRLSMRKHSFRAVWQGINIKDFSRRPQYPYLM